MKRLLLLIAFSTLTTLSFSQGFGGGVFAGISTSQMTGDGFVGFHKAGFYGGGFTDFRFTPRSTLQLEFSFLQRGSKQPPTVENNNQLKLFNLNYIEVPILYRWYGVKNMSLEIGPSASYLINTTQKDQAGDVPSPVPFNKFDLSVVGGLSYYLAKGKVEVNARYAISVIPTSTDFGRRWYHHVIAFSIRYWFKSSFDQAKATFNSSKEKKIKINIDLGKDE